MTSVGVAIDSIRFDDDDDDGNGRGQSLAFARA